VDANDLRLAEDRHTNVQLAEHQIAIVAGVRALTPTTLTTIETGLSPQPNIHTNRPSNAKGQ
jgi:hypothetical protein